MKDSNRVDSFNENIIILIGFDHQRVQTLLSDNLITKLVIFDSDMDGNYEKLYLIYQDRIKFYGGCIESNLDEYFKTRKEENILMKNHRIEISENYTFSSEK